MRATSTRSSSSAISESIRSTWFIATSSRISLRTSPAAVRGNAPVSCRCSGALGAALSAVSAAGVIVLLIWVYYAAQIFLFGAEFTRAWAHHYGTQQYVQDAEPRD